MKNKSERIGEMNLVATGYPFKRTVISSCVIAALFASIPGHTSDLSLYKEPTVGNTSLLLMLDSSAGMDDNGTGAGASGMPRAPSTGIGAGSIYLDYPECRGQALRSVRTVDLDIVYGKQTLTNTTTTGTFAYDMPYCGPAYSSANLSSSTASVKAAEIVKIKAFQYSRMDRMKVAMSALLSDASVPATIRMGLGQFSTQSDSNYLLTTAKTPQNSSPPYLISKSAVDARTFHKEGNDANGKIVVPSQTTTTPLDGDQRYKMRVAVTALGSGGLTPLASAFAESGAYMRGTTTLNTDRTSPQPSVVAAFTDNGKSYGPFPASGFNYSAAASKSGDAYITPVPAVATNVCDTQGIFLLTNGAPTQTPATTASDLMRNALADSTFTCPANDTTKSIIPVGTGATDYGWTCMGEFAKKLNAGNQAIKTAVAGFGNTFMPYLGATASTSVTQSNGKLRTSYKCNALTVGTDYTVNGVTTTLTQDAVNACNLGEISASDATLNTGKTVGGYGQGGFYPIVSPENLVDAIKNFIEILRTDLTAANTGSPTIPVDTLNAFIQQPYAYFAQFQPSLTHNYGIWQGNVKKYLVSGNTYKDKDSKNVLSNAGLTATNTSDFWNNSGSADGGVATAGGASSRLPVQPTERKLYTNRNVDVVAATATAAAAVTVTEVTTTGAALTAIPAEAGTGVGSAIAYAASNDPDRGFLLNLLGYPAATTGTIAISSTPNLRQMGAVIHSAPLFFTTKSGVAVAAVAASGSTPAVSIGDYVDRKDYVLFGTTQGVLQVVDASTGVEKFAFVPKEMIDRQKTGFLAQDRQTGLSAPVYNGIDGSWSQYSQYVKDSSNKVKANPLNVYGGLRMGGRSYYGLDLKDMETGTPKLLFKIDPAAAVASTALSYMGQSWSKPTIGFVNWLGARKLVMFVGGGYDTCFEKPEFKLSTAYAASDFPAATYPATNYADCNNVPSTKGNGVYMFDAKNGDLLWWTSSRLSANSTPGTGSTTQSTANSYLKYSVVSDIKAIDRDGDGLVDNLYFGDLGGQVFRADINNGGSTTAANFVVKRVERIANFAVAGKYNPRFYEAPTFTVHNDPSFTPRLFAVVSIESGDRSTPLNTFSSATGDNDRIYGIFDRDVPRADLFETLPVKGTVAVTNALKSSDNALLDLTSIGDATTAPKLAVMRDGQGWYHEFVASLTPTTGATTDVAKIKGFGPLSAIAGTLFATTYDAKDPGTTSNCSAGVYGKSYQRTYCLPYGRYGVSGEDGQCSVGTGRQLTTVNSAGLDLGSGLIPLAIGGTNNSSCTGSNCKATHIGPITGKPGQSLAEYTTPLKLDPKRWYEKKPNPSATAAD